MQTEDLAACKDYIRKSFDPWKSLQDEDIQMEKFFSIANIVYKATTTKDVEPKIIVFKKFMTTITGVPKSERGFLTLEQESLVALEMSKRGFGPKCYASNEEYRIEEYIDAQKMEFEDFKKIEIRRWHILAVANFNKLTFEGFNKKKVLYDSELPSAKYFQDFESKFASPSFSSEELEAANKIKDIASPENAEFIQKVIPKDNEELVPCHNDQHFNNILVSKETGKVTLVDYELASYSFKGDDIGCFTFYSTVNCFHPSPPYAKVNEENYPSEDLFREIAEYYVVFFDMDDETRKTQGEKMVFDKNLLNDYVKEKYNKEEFEAEVKKMIRSFKVSMLGLSVWIIRQAMAAPSIFALNYTQPIYQYYLKLKAEFEKEYF